MDRFAITYGWHVREKPQHFEPEDFCDVTPLELALEHFLTRVDGEFALRCNCAGHVARLDLRPDLSTVFLEIPQELRKLTQGGTAKIYFYEQGTDMTLSLQLVAGTLIIRFSTGPTASPRLVSLAGQSCSVTIDQFIHEWVRFLSAVLDALLELHPDLSRDSAYQDYRASLVSVQRWSDLHN
jgi:hypothetical protein